MRSKGVTLSPEFLDKLPKIAAEFGAKGVHISILLISKISEAGWISRVDVCRRIAHCGGTYGAALIDEVVRGLLRLGLLDRRSYESFSILTSRDCQLDYISSNLADVERLRAFCTDRIDPDIQRILQRVISDRDRDMYANLDENSGIPGENELNEKKEKKEKRTKKEKKEKKENHLPDEAFQKNDYEKILSDFNTLCPDLPKLRMISEPRKAKIRTRLAEMRRMIPGKTGEETLRRVFELAGKSEFLNGKNARGWTASFDWLVENSQNWVKVYEGRYDQKTDERQVITKKVKNLNVNDDWK